MHSTTCKKHTESFEMSIIGQTKIIGDATYFVLMQFM